MKKSRKIASIVFAVISAIIGSLIIAGVSVASTHNEASSPTAEMSSWMSHIKDDTLLKDVVIPGSHDSGCDEMMWMAKTQNRSVLQQLECGTRYFDLRVSKEDDGYKMFHGPIKAGNFVTILEDVNNFLNQNPSETLVLDFQQFDNDVEFDLLNLLETHLAGKLISNDFAYDDVAFVNALTLGEARGKCLVFWGKQSGEEFLKPYVFVRDNNNGTRLNSLLHSFYDGALNRNASSVYIKKALPQYIELRKQNMDGLFVLQGQLTDPILLFGPQFLEATHHKNMDKYVANLATSENLSLINIIMRDFVSPHKNALTISLNIQKGNVKESSNQAFLTLIEQNI